MDDNYLANQNEINTERLGNKVSKLKSIAIDIQSESKEHLKFLDGMSFDFENTRGFLNNTTGYLNKLIHQKKGSNRMICYLVIILTISFFILHVIFSWKK